MISVRKSFKSLSAEKRNSYGVSGVGLAVGVGLSLGVTVDSGVALMERVGEALGSDSGSTEEGSDSAELNPNIPMARIMAPLFHASRVMNLFQIFFSMLARPYFYKVLN